MEKKKERRGNTKGSKAAPGSYGEMTRKELYEMAKTRGFKGMSKYRKAQLLELLMDSGKTKPSIQASGPLTEVEDVKAAEPALSPAPDVESAEAGDAARTSEAIEVESVVPQEPKDVFLDWGYPLPERYGIDVMGAAAKDPNWIFVYWDLSGGRREEVALKYGREIFASARWHVRVVDTGCGECVDFPVNVDSRNWYIPAAEDTTFRIQIGLLTPDGEFVEFASAREVRTPRSRPADNISEQWMVADELFQRFLKQAGTPGGSELSSSELAARLKEKLNKH